MTQQPKPTPVVNADTAFIVKNLERRWGLALVSFLPWEAHEAVSKFQSKLARIAYPSGQDIKREGQPILEFYESSQLHCTHLTLTRSSGWGPVRLQDFVQQGKTLFKLFEIVQQVTSKIGRISVTLRAVSKRSEGAEIVLVGRSADKESTEHRRLLLEHLNAELPGAFHISRRSWDNDPSKYDAVHCMVAFIKRITADHAELIECLRNVEVKPISVALKDVTIVHHRYRSLRSPQEGMFSLPLGKDISEEVNPERFARELNLIDEQGATGCSTQREVSVG